MAIARAADIVAGGGHPVVVGLSLAIMIGDMNHVPFTGSVLRVLLGQCMIVVPIYSGMGCAGVFRWVGGTDPPYEFSIEPSA